MNDYVKEQVYQKDSQRTNRQSIPQEDLNDLNDLEDVFDDPSQQIVPKKTSHQEKNDKRILKSLGDVYSIHQFSIKHGKAIDTSPEFATFKRANITKWGAVSLVIHLLEEYLKKYHVPHAVIDGGKVLLLAEDELTRPDEDDLFGCILNQPQVREFLEDP